MTDILTTLTSTGPLLTKRWTKTGLQAYDRAKWFTVEEIPVSSLRTLAAALDAIQNLPMVCVIRGRLKSGAEAGPEDNLFARNLETFANEAHNWCGFDIDGFVPVLCDPVLEPEAAIEEFIKTKLPKEFHGASHHWQLSSSAGAPGKEHLLKAHLWFWLHRPVGGQELDAWARWTKSPVDITVFRTVQVHYTASPTFDPGVTDPVPVRSGTVHGKPEVEIVLAPEDFRHASEPAQRNALADPTAKKGLIGAFCRVYDPTRVVDELIPDCFEFEDEDQRRLTWLQGGGNPGGAVITDDGMHVFNSHSTDPFEGRACNTWDLVRVHKFGHLDRGACDFELDQMSTTPSYQAMVAFARADPEVQSEMLEAVLAVAETPKLLAEEDPPAAKPGKAETPAEEVPVKTPEFDDRAVKLERMLAAIRNSPTTQDLEHRLAPLLRQMELSDGDRAQCVAAIQASFKALAKTNLPIAIARTWLTPPVGAQTFVHYTEEGRLLGTIENMEQILRNLNAVVRYNTMSKEDEVVFTDQSFSVDNRANVGLSLVQSECNRVDMKIQVGTIKSFINRLAERNQYNPPLEWILSRPWDGTDHLRRWYGTVTTPNPALKEMLMFKWALQLVQILYNSGTEMARAVLTFTGAQYAGKTRWFKALAPEGMVLAGHVLDVHDKDNIKKAISYWITEFGELDGTLRKSDLAVLKAFISRTDDEMRLPYAAASSKFPRRTGFGATVNEPEFLKDPTGNTRYWALQADAIDADHSVDMQQVWAQVHHLWLNEGAPKKLQHWLSPEELATLNASNDDFTETDPLEELARTKLGWLAQDDVEWMWCTATQVAEQIGLRTVGRGDVTRLGSIIRRLNGNKHKRSTTGARVLWVPVSNVLDK